jgi:hypothetical protein
MTYSTRCIDCMKTQKVTYKRTVYEGTNTSCYPIPAYYYFMKGHLISFNVGLNTSGIRIMYACFDVVVCFSFNLLIH